MAGTLVDANVLIDVLTEDEEWCDGSAAMLVEAMHQRAILTNPIVFAEVSLGFNRIEELDDALPEKFCRRIELPWAAAFLAGTAFVKYGAVAVSAARRCPTSTSARTRRCPA
jgi:predicted nucleic acid-binding protein